MALLETRSFVQDCQERDNVGRVAAVIVLLNRTGAEHHSIRIWVLGTACHNKCEGMLPYGGLPASVAAVEYAYPRCVRLPEVVRS